MSRERKPEMAKTIDQRIQEHPIMNNPTMENRIPGEATRDTLSQARRDVTEKATEAKENVQHKAAELKNAVMDSATEVWDSVKDAGAGVKEGAADDLGRVREFAAECAEDGRAKIRELSDVAEQRIRKEPLTSICIAAGVGFLIGALWRRI